MFFKFLQNGVFTGVCVKPDVCFGSVYEKTIDEFKPGTTISDLERDSYSAQEYEGRVTDKTVNYFYALYMLSKCDGFLASSHCSGVTTVRNFNTGKYECNDVVREMILKGLITVKE